MENLQYSKIFRKNWEIVALIIGVTVVLALIISLLQPFQYSAGTKILVIQRQEKNLDAYTANKSAERIGKNLANVIFTSSFYNEVIDSNSNVKDKFSQDSYERRKEWDKNVKTSVVPETGILQIQVYDADRNYASQLVKNISYVLINKGSEYHGGGSDIELKIVDDVFISKYPVRPNIILNAAIAVIIGFLLGSAFVILREAKKFEAVEQASLFEQKDSLDTVDANENTDKYIDIEDEQESEIMAENIVDEDEDEDTRKIEVKTMYDHLQN
jgi:protein tyrosine kinase modulator